MTSAVTGRRSNQLSHWAVKRKYVMRLYHIPSKLNTQTFPEHLHFIGIYGPVESGHSMMLRIIFMKPDSPLWSDPRPISNSQLHTLRCFHLCPIKLVVFKWSFYLRMGYLISEGASRLDAFSVYPFRTWLPGHRPGGLTGTPEVRPSRSSRTKDSSLQISCARAG